MIKRALISTFMLSLFSMSLSAQPGGTWTRTLLTGTCNQCYPVDIAFADSNTGFVITGLGEYSTFDGGKTIISSTSFLNSNQGKAYCPEWNDFVFFEDDGGYDYCGDSGKTWTYEYIPGSFSDSSGKKVNATALGSDQTLISLNDAVAMGTIVDSNGWWEYRFYISHDGGGTYLTLGDTIHSGVLAGIQWGYAANDSDLFASGYDANYRNFLAHSTDYGNHWTYTYPIDTNSWKLYSYFQHIVKGQGIGHYYMPGGRIDTTGFDTVKKRKVNLRIDDYLETTNDGATWQTENNVSGGRVTIISNPAPNVLLATVAHVQQEGGDDGFVALGGAGYDGVRDNFVDSLYFSSDNGATWSKDTITFDGNSIGRMVWFSPTNGYVVTWSDSSTYLYHYSIPDSTKEIVQTPVYTIATPLTVFPSPAQLQISIVPFGSVITIVDVLGHPYDCSRNVNTLDVSSLPPGVYFVSDGRSQAKFVKE